MRFLLLSVLFIATVFAGESSGGGAGIFCPESITNQPRVQTLDLYEGQVRYGYIIQENNLSLENQISDYLNSLSLDFSLMIDMKDTIKVLRQKANFLPKGVSIKVPDDLGKEIGILLPTGCELGGIGFYEENGDLKISTDAYTQLSNTQKTAFWIHEAFYRLAYKYLNYEDGNGFEPPELSAKPIRKFTAYSLSVHPDGEEVYKLSELGNWRNLLNSKSHSSVFPCKGVSPKWTAINGYEEWFQSFDFESCLDKSITHIPVYLPDDSKELVITYNSNVIDMPTLQCVDLKGQDPGDYMKHKYYSLKTRLNLKNTKQVFAKLEKNCSMYYLNGNSGQNGQELKIDKIGYGNENFFQLLDQDFSYTISIVPYFKN